MECKEVRGVLSRYLDEESPKQERASVGKHLARCPACRAEHLAQQRVWALLGGIEPLRSPNLAEAIEARLSEPRGWPSVFFAIHPRSIGHVAAAAVLIGAFAWMGLWAGSARAGSDHGEHERVFAELLSDAPPGMEIVVLLGRIGE